MAMTRELLIKGTAAMTINGDWTNGAFKSKKFTDFGYVRRRDQGQVRHPGRLVRPAEEHQGQRRDDGLAEDLRSKAGQDAFNPIKGSIPARNDLDQSLYDDYQKAAIADFASNELLPSVVHGAAAKESWVTDFVNTMNAFAGPRDVAATQAALVKIAKDAGVG